jgi:hypothetical protein
MTETLIAILGAALMGGSFIVGFNAGLKYAPRGDAPLPRLVPKKGGSNILEYADPTQAEY